MPIYLRRDRRVEIAQSLVDGVDFPCHATVNYDVDWEDPDGFPEADTADAVMCAGAAKAILLDGGSTQMMRIAERLGMADLDAVENHKVDVWPLLQWQTLAEGATADNPIEDDEEVETCNTVGENCLAPAGYLGANGGIAYGTEAADLECPGCGEAVCSECADDKGRCGWCAEQEEDDE